MGAVEAREHNTEKEQNMCYYTFSISTELWYKDTCHGPLKVNAKRWEGAGIFDEFISTLKGMLNAISSQHALYNVFVHSKYETEIKVILYTFDTMTLRQFKELVDNELISVFKKVKTPERLGGDSEYYKFKEQKLHEQFNKTAAIMYTIDNAVWNNVYELADVRKLIPNTYKSGKTTHANATITDIEQYTADRVLEMP